MTLDNIVVLLVLSGVIYLIYKHLNISALALEVAREQAQKHDVQLLDQSSILKRIRIRRDKHSFLALERCYQFEFSTVGDTRYYGRCVFLGERLQSVELDPHKNIMS